MGSGEKLAFAQHTNMRDRGRASATPSIRSCPDGSSIVAGVHEKSRGWFPVGRTRVTCTADDTSGNRATAKVTVTVKRAG
jgi:hypothetical protein